MKKAYTSSFDVYAFCFLREIISKLYVNRVYPIDIIVIYVK